MPSYGPTYVREDIMTVWRKAAAAPDTPHATALEVRVMLHMMRGADEVRIADELLLPIADAAKALPQCTFRPELMFSRNMLVYWSTPSDFLVLTMEGEAVRPVAASFFVSSGLDVPGVVFAAVFATIDGSRTLLMAPRLWRFGTDVLKPDDEPHLNAMKHLMAALLLFCDQKLVAVTRRPHSRQVQRAALRTGEHMPETLTITLRRREMTRYDGAGEAQDWQFRWAVRGHWRAQFYPSDKTHRPVWVQPYIKGPDDKPLKARAAGVLFDVAR